MYSIQNAEKFEWASVNGNLLPERLSHLESYLIGDKILDVGCAGGGYVEFLSKKNLEVTGVDNQSEFLKHAKKQGRSGNYVEASITELPFPDNYFDSVYCFDVLEHIADDRRAISELSRVASKRLIITVPSEGDYLKEFGLIYKTYQDPTHLRYYSHESLGSLCRSVNPKKIKIFPEGYLPCQSLVSSLIESVQFPNLAESRTQNFLHPKTGYRTWLYTSLVRRLLGKIQYKILYLGLVAIVDLN